MRTAGMILARTALVGPTVYFFFYRATSLHQSGGKNNPKFRI
jgi:hypothetical protein